MIKSDNYSRKCPVCGREQAEDASTCLRCGADLTRYKAAIRNHAYFLRQAAIKLKTDPQKARELADRAAALSKTDDTVKIQALAELCSKNYRQAVARWRIWSELQS